MRYVIVVDKIEDWPFDRYPNVDLISAKKYLTEETDLDQQSIRIFNLCRSQRYQSLGYYVSLIAQARSQKVIPSVLTIQDINSPSLHKVVCEEMNELIQKSLEHIKSDEFVLSVYFGKNISPHYDKLCRKINSLFQAPLLRAFFYKDKNWRLKTIKALSLFDIPASHFDFARRFSEEYFSKKRFHHKSKPHASYSLAILVNPQEQNPPSNEKAIKKFIEAAEHLDFSVEIIGKDDFNRLPEFDALFIRETTAVTNHTYRFARRALAEGIVVMDDPVSILKCANKVYLTELLKKAKIDMPNSLILQKSSASKIKDSIGFPCVLKIPDGAFSQGVMKVEKEIDLESALHSLFEKSDLILAQEFTPSDFDWRIGVLNKKILFASKYFMAKGHWQIMNWDREGEPDLYGDDAAVALSDIPEKVAKTALRAANLIGDGFYGVDLKEVDGRVLVIEINDNPNIDFGVEDKALGNVLYYEIIKEILQRIHAKKAQASKLL